MGLFDKFKKGNVNVGNGGIKQSGVSVPNNKVSLEKHKVNLDKAIVNLSKSSGVDLSKVRAQVVIAIDYSGSMDRLYRDRNGVGSSEVQSVLTKLFPIALKFDDDGSMDIWLFEDEYTELEPMVMGNFENYVNEEIMSKHLSMGGTRYYPVLSAIEKDKRMAKEPIFILFITDGDNFDSDKRKTDAIIRELSKKNIFIQFIGIGHASFKYLEKLDDLDGRVCDNTGFEKFSDLSGASDDEVYDKVLKQYADWLKVKGLV